jgi:hypothetical protein
MLNVTSATITTATAYKVSLRRKLTKA